MSDLNKEAEEKSSNGLEKKNFNYKILLGVLFLVVLIVVVIYFYKDFPENSEPVNENSGEEKIVVKNTDDCYKYFEDDKLAKCLEVRYFNSAITNKDVSYCEKISDSEIKEKCIIGVNRK